MSKNIEKTNSYKATPLGETAISPLAVRSVFWRSRYLGKSEFTHHLPLAFWLAEVSRPMLVVQVAMDDPQCYFAFCQAVDKLNLSARCLGLGDWDGENAEVPTEIEAHNDQNYADFSKITALPLAQAQHYLGRRRADILIADLAPASLDTEALLSLCETGISDQGCALFYGVNDIHADANKSGFLNSLRDTYKSVWFDDHAGVVIVLTGQDQNERLLQLADLNEDSPEYYNVQTVFSRLGAGHYYEWLSRELTTNADAAQASLAKLKTQLKVKTQEFEALSEAYSERDRAAGDAQIALFDLTQEIEAGQAKFEAEQEGLSEELAQAQKTLGAATKERDAALAGLKTVRGDLEAMALSNAKSESLRDDIQKERDDLTQELSLQKLEVGELSQRLSKVESEHVQLQVTLEKAETGAAKVEPLQQALDEQYVASQIALDQARKERDALRIERDLEQEKVQRIEAARTQALEVHLQSESTWRADLEAMSQRKAEAENTLKQVQAKQDAAEQAGAVIEAERNSRFRETTALTKELLSAQARIETERNSRFRETAALTKELLSAQADLEQKDTGVAQETATQTKAHRDLFDRYSALQLKCLNVEKGFGRDKVLAVEAALQDERGIRFRETQVLSAEIATMTTQDSQVIAGLRDEIAWRKRSSAEAAERSHILLQLREWQASELQQVGRMPSLRRDSGLKQKVRILEAAPQFDADWYVRTYPDVADLPRSPGEHFLQFGLFEGRSPGPDFDPVAYYITHPDALKQRINAVIHAAEGAVRM